LRATPERHDIDPLAIIINRIEHEEPPLENAAV
jgi:hypothetical protein